MKKILKFSATWCKPCKDLVNSLNIAEISTPIESIDIDEQSDLASQYSVRGVPTLVMLENGIETKRLVGSKTPTELKTWAEA
jgi:thioredoxin 1